MTCDPADRSQWGTIPPTEANGARSRRPKPMGHDPADRSQWGTIPPTEANNDVRSRDRSQQRGAILRTEAKLGAIHGLHSSFDLPIIFISTAQNAFHRSSDPRLGALRSRAQLQRSTRETP